MKYNKHILLFLFIAFCFADCKKFPEGPAFSLRSRVQRLEGDWKVQQYLIDGADSTTVKYPVDCFYLITNKEHTQTIFDHCGPGQARWEFDENRTSLILLGSGSPLFLTMPIEWKIMKLKFKEMHLQTNFNSKEYDIYFTKL